MTDLSMARLAARRWAALCLVFILLLPALHGVAEATEPPTAASAAATHPLSPAVALADEPQLHVHGIDAARSLTIAELAQLAGGERVLAVHEPHELAGRRYRGVAAGALLDAVYGDAWRQAGAVLFECADGYRALISTDKLARHDALLAWADDDAESFALRNRLQGDEAVSLGPFYLVWDNRDSPELLADGANDWPYQVIGLMLMDARAHLAAAWPADDAGADVMRGFDGFRRHCAACHAVNGAGGHKARDLNQPQSVTRSLPGPALRHWMLAPGDIRPGTTMPGLPASLADRAAVAADIETYLLRMAADDRH